MTIRHARNTPARVFSGGVGGDLRGLRWLIGMATLLSCPLAASLGKTPSSSSSVETAVAGVVATAEPACAARSAAELDACQARLRDGSVTQISLENRIQCRNGSRPCLDLRERAAPLWLTGASGAAGMYRTNYSRPLLVISGTQRLVIQDVTFEDALWPSCFPRLAPPGPLEPMIKIYDAAMVVFKNCTFLRGFNVGVDISTSSNIVFSHSTWLESQRFGVHSDKYSRHVHFFGNQFLHGRNNAFIGTLSHSSFQGNDFVNNHHIACFNQSGGQLDIIQPSGPNNNLTIAANRVVNGSITGGDVGQDWHKLSTYAFEINSGIHVFLLHNDAYNHSGWSIFPNSNNWPGGANVTLEANRMCSRCLCGPFFPSLCVPGATHTVCTGWDHPSTQGHAPNWCNETDEPWVHRARQCEANSNERGVCGDADCGAPVRPRGELRANTDRGGQTSVSWLVADVDPLSVRVVRNFSLSGIPVPVAVSDALRGKSGNGSEALPDVPSIASGGELVALWAEGYGVLDVTVVALIGAPPTPPPANAR
jgi:hypothetical protein